MRIGFLCVFDPDDPSSISGMPFAMKRQLLRSGFDVVNVCPRPPRPTGLAARLIEAVERRAPALFRAARPLRDLSARRPGRALAGSEEEDRQSVLARARALAREVDRQVAARGIDLLFGCSISAPLYGIASRVPVIYASDTTARLINETYPTYRDRSDGYKRGADELETWALQRADAVVVATQLARRSAIVDYRVAPGRIHVVPLGANIEARGVFRRSSPSADAVRLIMIAADPVRKRADLAVEVVHALRARGLAAELTLIGPPTAAARRSPWVRCTGPLRLSEERDRRRTVELLADSHLMIMPSSGEAYGIAPCEAAHVGLPSVVSDAGGLPEVVLDGETGLVLPVAAPAARYAEAIAALVLAPARYEALSRAAARRAAEVGTWDRWGDRVAPLVEEVAAAATPVAGRRGEEGRWS